MKVLICDDSTFMRQIITTVLNQSDCEIVGEARNGLECIEKYKELTPDLILMDVTMPEMDGLSALKELKKINKNVKVIICSSMGQEPIVKEAIQNGAADFIVKPFQKERILEVIHSQSGV